MDGYLEEEYNEKVKEKEKEKNRIFEKIDSLYSFNLLCAALETRNLLDLDISSK